MLGLIKRMKIFHRLVFFMLLLILLVCAGFLAVTTLSFKTYDEMLYEQASRAMNLSVSGIENEISNIEELSMNMALDSRIQEQLVSIQGGSPPTSARSGQRISRIKLHNTCSPKRASLPYGS